MIASVREALSLLTPPERRRIYLVMVSSAAAAVIQVLAILAVLPFIVLLANPDLLETGRVFRRLSEFTGSSSWRDFLILFGLAGIVLLTIGNLFVALEQWLSDRFFCHLRYRVEERLLRRLLSRPYEYFLTRHSGRLGDVVLRQVERMVDGVIGAFVTVFSSLALAGFIVLMLLVVSFETTLVSLAGLVLAYAALYFLLRRRVRSHGEELTRLSASASTAVKETLDGIKEIQVRRAADFFARRFGRAATRMARLEVSYGLMQYLPHLLLEAVVFSGFVGIALYFLYSTDDRGLSLSYIALYGIAVYRLVPALKNVFEGMSTVHHNADAVAIVREHYAAKGRAARPRTLPRPPALIRLEGVSYRHVASAQRQVDRVDLEIPAGTSLCLFGPSGCGKSTLLNLLAGLITPQEGRVTVDGVELGADTLSSWHDTIGYAPQQVYLFDDSIAANIAFGVEPEAIDRRRIETVANLANLDRFVRSLPQGYDTRIGDRGLTMSGGQRQRIGIARVLYHDPDLLCFDESFTGLDSANRDAILDELFAMTSAKTLVFSSHEPAIAARCEKVAVIEHGCLLALGDYRELVETRPDLAGMLSRRKAEAR